MVVVVGKERPSSSSSIVISHLRTDGMVAHFSDHTKYWPQFSKVWFNLGYPVDMKQYFGSCSDLDIFLLKYSSPPRQRQHISLTRQYYHLRLKKILRVGWHFSFQNPVNIGEEGLFFKASFPWDSSTCFLTWDAGTISDGKHLSHPNTCRFSR